MVIPLTLSLPYRQEVLNRRIDAAFPCFLAHPLHRLVSIWVNNICEGNKKEISMKLPSIEMSF
jgi:hypothetical protein